MLNRIAFIRDEIRHLPGVSEKPTGGIARFCARIGYALSLGLKEKEIFVFGLLQWAVIGLAYLLWVQMLDWIPESVWRSAAESDGGSIADVVLLAWSFVCVGLAAFPVGILSGCMGAAHFLHRQGRPSSVAACLRLVLPQGWALWSFHWIDGWITVSQILARLPKRNGGSSLFGRTASEALYYAWKLGVAGMLPGLVVGNGLITAARQSVIFVKENFAEVAGLRAGYSAMCWIVGLSAYVGTCVFLAQVDIVPTGDAVYRHIYTIYLWVGVPVLAALAVVMLILRPIYVLALCDLYSDALARKGLPPELPDNPPRSVSAAVAFGCLCLLVAVVYAYRVELGIVDLLSVPYGQSYASGG